MKNNKLLYITDEILIKNNAPTVHIVEVCNNLKKLGYEVELFAPSLSKFKTNNFKVTYIPMTKVAKSLLFHPLLTAMLIYKLKSQKIDTVYIRHFPFLLASVLAAKSMNVPCILEVNGKIVEETNHTRENEKEILAKIHKFLSQKMFNNSEKIIAVTLGIKEYLTQKYKLDAKKNVVIENGINLNQFKKTSQEKSREKIGLEKNTTYIGYVGSLYKYQGVSHIIDSAKIITRKFPDVKFIIIGNGPENEKEILIKQISSLKLAKNVQLFGPIDHEKVIEYINAFDICLCYPTNFRDNATSPFKLFEYLACGKAVISSDIAGLREFFQNSILYAEAGNAKKLSEKIKYLLNNPKIKVQLENDGRIFIKNHTWKNVAKKISEVIQEQPKKNTSKGFDYNLII